MKDLGTDVRKTLKQITQLQHSLSAIEEGADFHIKEKLKMLFVYHSNAIEGSKLSLQDTVDFLQDDIIKDTNTARDHMDALGHAAAIGFVGSKLRSGEKIDRGFVCEVNDLLTKHVGTLEDAPEQATISGTYKIAPNSVRLADGAVHNYVDPALVASDMEELFAYCETSTAHPVVTAAVAHYNFVRIHPFQHGNGRGARILMNLILQHYDLPPAVIQVQDKERYLGCLHSADEGNILPFVGLVANALAETMQMVLEAYQAECGGVTAAVNQKQHINAC
jgi:Fic family protein